MPQDHRLTGQIAADSIAQANAGNGCLPAVELSTITAGEMLFTVISQ